MKIESLLVVYLKKEKHIKNITIDNFSAISKDLAEYMPILSTMAKWIVCSKSLIIHYFATVDGLLAEKKLCSCNMMLLHVA